MNRIQCNGNCRNEFDFDGLLIFLLIILNFRRYSYEYNFKNSVKNNKNKDGIKANIVNDKQNQANEKFKTAEANNKKNVSDEESESSQLISGEGLELLKCGEKKEAPAQRLPSVYENKKELNQNNLFIKMPVILAQKNISIVLEPVYNFDDDVLEIKNVKEQAYLKKTDLIMLPHEISEIPSGKLFINGFVRKSIEYVALNEQNNEYAIGTVKNIIANISFLFTSIIEFDILPAINENMHLEPIYCDIEKQHINETEIYDIVEKGKKESPINIFKRIHEKMVIDLDVKILQKQIVNITKIYQS